MFLLALLAPGIHANSLVLALPANTYSFITDPYATPGETLETALSSALQHGDEVFFWDCTEQAYEYYTYDGPGNWVHPDGSIGGPPNCPPPGQGFIYDNKSGSSETLTLTGTPGSGPSTSMCDCGEFSLVGPTGDSPTGYSYDDIVGSAPVIGSTLYLWNGSAYTVYTYPTCCGWTPGVPVVPAGSSVFIKVPCNPAPCKTGVVLSIAGPALISPGHTKMYAVTLINYGPSDFNGFLRLDGIPKGIGGNITLTPPPGSSPVSDGFEVSPLEVPACSSASFTFSLTCNSLTPSIIPMAAGDGNGLSQEAQLTVNVVASQDPNDKSGPTGVGSSHYLVGSPGTPVLPYDILGYAITFENLTNATAPAQRVVITDQLDPTTMDVSSFQFGPIFFGSEVVTPPFDVNPYSDTVLSYNVDGNIINVQINATNDLNSSSPTYGQVTWTIQALDPGTGLAPTNPEVGFLPPNTTPPEGQGMVTFTVNPLSSLVTGDLVTNSARIVFDQNGAITTGTWTNTIIFPPAFTIAGVAGQVTITWASWTLQEASSLNGPWTNSAVQVSPWTFTPSESTKFYRLQMP